MLQGLASDRTQVSAVVKAYVIVVCGGGDYYYYYYYYRAGYLPGIKGIIVLQLSCIYNLWNM